MPLSTKLVQSSYNLPPLPGMITLPALKEQLDSKLSYLNATAAAKTVFKSLPEIQTSEGALVGIEVEVENVNLDMWEHTVPGWQVTKDSSLRNNGAEFISCPLTLDCVPIAVTGLYVILKKGQKATADFSWRTSLHVHLNVRSLTPDQVASLLASYLVFEQEFFAYAGKKRDRVNFCVPLHETSMNLHINYFFFGKKSLGDLCEVWHKYAAANLIPLTGSSKDAKAGKKGTIEFRHMGGTADPIRVVQWINLLIRLHSYARLHNFEETKNIILTIRTRSGYENFKRLVFGDCADYFPECEEKFPYSGLLFAKECLSVYEEPEPLSDFSQTGLMEMVQKRYVPPKKAETKSKAIWQGAHLVLSEWTVFPTEGFEGQRIMDGKYCRIYGYMPGNPAKVSVSFDAGSGAMWYYAHKFLVKLEEHF